ASVQLLVNFGDVTTVDLPAQVIPAESAIPVALDLLAFGVQAVSTKAPGQLILRVEMNANTEDSLITWSRPVYAHFDQGTNTFLVYDESVLKSKHNNGDLTGEFAVPGLPAG